MNALSGSVDLDQSSVEVAMLDVDGVIVEVNEAWARFSENNGGSLSRTGAGMSYLEAWDAGPRETRPPLSWRSGSVRVSTRQGRAPPT
jgi:hypothetical protein